MIIIINDYTLVVGESARRPIGKFYNLDGKPGTVYSGRERETGRGREDRVTEAEHGTGMHDGDHISHRKGGSKGVSGQMERNVDVGCYEYATCN